MSPMASGWRGAVTRRSVHESSLAGYGGPLTVSMQQRTCTRTCHKERLHSEISRQKARNLLETIGDEVSEHTMYVADGDTSCMYSGRPHQVMLVWPSVRAHHFNSFVYVSGARCIDSWLRYTVS